ncbi:hypothetical protein [Trichlorobacter lovleyi]|uniref:Uncharacterized protein n=1 Tax=Trichlorobacter lovleyi (strain ATCC BAA-1151 / DSM 17278 / SZ) TaxID=398767 RepID=B3E8V5_TRIL1|nr:hypothetical protein [Trichlorobacter lovleyi]ACD95223.1 hypothetical protein Glov_1507 [Trichlorobacter lovleyi SZ]
MQVHAIYEDGKLTFQQPVYLRAKRIELDVIIPDKYIEEEAQLQSTIVQPTLVEQQPSTAHLSPTRERLDALLGKWRHHGGPSGKADYKALWHEHLEEKYIER